MAQVAFNTQHKKFLAEFNQSLTAQMIIKGLPWEGAVNLWGDEIYLDTGIQASDLHATMDVNVSDVGYRHEEKRLCIFFGRTPTSISDKPVPAFPIVVIGRILCPPEELRSIKAGETIKVVLNDEKPAIPAAPPGDRKLTQDEIDELVKKLLATKSSGQGLKPS